MIEFVLGFIIGIITLWLSANSKMRFDVYAEKLKIYFKLQSITSKMMFLCEPTRKDKPNAELNLEFNKLCLELIDLTSSRSFILPSVIVKALAEFSILDWKNEKINSNENIIFLHALLTRLIREDLNIDNIDKINSMALSLDQRYKKISKLLKKQIKSNRKNKEKNKSNTTT